MTRWFRVYEDVIDEPKIIMLPESLRWYWLATLCVASKNGGKLPPLDHVALSFRQTPRRAAALLARLQAAGLLDDTGDGLSPHNWDKRQFRTDRDDATGAERVRRFRERRRVALQGDAGETMDAARDAAEDVTGEVTEIVTGDIPSGQRFNAVTPQRPESEADSEPEPESDSETDSLSSRGGSAAQRGREIVSEGNGQGNGKDGSAEAASAAALKSAAGEDIAANKESAARRLEAAALADAIAQAFARAGQTPPDLARAAFWLDLGYDRAIVLATIDRILASKSGIGSLNYFDASIRRAHEAPNQARYGAPHNAAGAGSLVASPELDIEKAVAFYARTQVWSRHAGPAPGLAGCRASHELLARYDLRPDGEKLRTPPPERPPARDATTPDTNTRTQEEQPQDEPPQDDRPEHDRPHNSNDGGDA